MEVGWIFMVYRTFLELHRKTLLFTSFLKLKTFPVVAHLKSLMVHCLHLGPSKNLNYAKELYWPIWCILDCCFLFVCLFVCLEQVPVSFSCLGDYGKAFLMWSSGIVLWTTKIQSSQTNFSSSWGWVENDWIFILRGTFPLILHLLRHYMPSMFLWYGLSVCLLYLRASHQSGTQRLLAEFWTAYSPWCLWQVIAPCLH